MRDHFSNAPDAPKLGRSRLALVIPWYASGGNSMKEPAGWSPQQSPFAIEDSVFDEHTHVVSLAGEIDISVSPRLRRRLIALVRAGAARLVVDLSRATFIDASLLDVLVVVHVRLLRHGGRLAIVCNRPELYRLFELTGLSTTLEVFAGRDEALAAVSVDRG